MSTTIDYLLLKHSQSINWEPPNLVLDHLAPRRSFFSWLKSISRLSSHVGTQSEADGKQMSPYSSIGVKGLK